MSKKTKYAVSRSIEGISLNGQEFILASNGKILKFDTKELCIDYAIKTVGENYADFDINICSIAEDNSYELV